MMMMMMMIDVLRPLLAYHVHKSGRKTSIIIITATFVHL